jgi:hypothetical protein
MKLRTLLFVILLAACRGEEEFDPVFTVPDDLLPYVNNFIHEGELRGHTIEIKNLIIRYDESMEFPVCANCNSNAIDAEVQKIISVGTTACWTNNYEQEALIFHELGHCYLGRNHTSEKLPNGAPKSMMVPNDITIYSPCVYQIGEEPCDKTSRREYYLDELFDPNTTPVPEWAK